MPMTALGETDGSKQLHPGSMTHVPLLALLLSLSLPPLLAALDPAQAKQELDVMRKLRRAVQDADAGWLAGRKGWDQRGDSSHPCKWQGVRCNEQQRITKIEVFDDNTGIQKDRGQSPVSLLLPELAQLQQLEALRMVLHTRPLSTGWPSEWVRTGAFPSLTELELGFATAEGPLPDIQPGALPQLRTLNLYFPGLISSLPASWSQLPALRTLDVSVQVTGDLPAQWATGFQQLTALAITNEVEVNCGRVEGPAAAGGRSAAAAGSNGSSNNNGSRQAPPPLSTHAPLGGESQRFPTEWASGFPRLTRLMLSNLSFSGPLPPEWMDAFPLLESWSLEHTCLQGPLPVNLFARPNLTQVRLYHNHFTGTLPSAWSNAQVEFLLLARNQLTGPAFPPAWLQPGALPRLQLYSAAGNSQLSGTLPTSVPWIKLNDIELQQTAVHPSIPASWCNPGATRVLQRMTIGQDDVKPDIPPCAQSSQTWLSVNNVLWQTLAAPAPSSARTKHALAVILSWLTASLSVMVVGAAATLAVTRLLQQRTGKRACQRHQPAVKDVSRVHLLSAALRASGGRQSSPRSAQKEAPGNLAAPALNAQLAALVQARLGNASHSVRLLAHGLQGQPARGELACPDAATDVSPSVDGVQEHGPLLPARPASPSAVLASWCGSNSGSGSGGGSSGSGRGSSSRVAGHLLHASKPLPKDSLHMGVAELEFVVTEDGLLVELGCGCHAAVYLARMQGRKVAVKVFLLEQSAGLSHILAEVEAMRHCVHPRIVPLYGVAVEGPALMLVMDLMEGGSLKEALHSPALREQLRWGAGGCQVALDVAEGLHYLHNEMRLMHGDLKSSNVLLSADGRACLADLGMAQVMESRAARTAAGFTAAYAAPEQLLGQRCTLAVDMYSFGILLAELATQTVGAVRGELCLPQAPHDCPQGVVQLIHDCLSHDPAQRPTAAEALQRLQAYGAE